MGSIARHSTVPSLSLSDLSRESGVRLKDSASSVGPSASAVDAGSSVSSFTSPNKASFLERKLQSERDAARNEIKRLRLAAATASSAGASQRRPGPARYGGESRRTGGGDPRAQNFCRDFNSPAGCHREICKFKHACSKVWTGTGVHAATRATLPSSITRKGPRGSLPSLRLASSLQENTSGQSTSCARNLLLTPPSTVRRPRPH